MSCELLKEARSFDPHLPQVPPHNKDIGSDSRISSLHSFSKCSTQTTKQSAFSSGLTALELSTLKALCAIFLQLKGYPGQETEGQRGRKSRSSGTAGPMGRGRHVSHDTHLPCDCRVEITPQLLEVRVRWVFHLESLLWRVNKKKQRYEMRWEENDSIRSFILKLLQSERRKRHAEIFTVALHEKYFSHN